MVDRKAVPIYKRKLATESKHEERERESVIMVPALLEFCVYHY